MNSLTIITSKIIDSSISSSLIENFPYKKKKVTNDEKSLFLGKSPFEFIINFDEYYDSSSELCIFDEALLNTIKFSPVYFNTLYFRDLDVAKYVVSVLSQKYKAILIFDENSEFFITAEQFLSK